MLNFMKRAAQRSHCPVNYALESYGDSWSLLIVRDIIFWGKHTFREFLASDEAIASNVLAARLAHLETQGIIGKQPHPTDRRREVYTLTEKGLDLIPIVLEMAGWATQYDPATTAPHSLKTKVYADRDGMYSLIRKTVRKGGSLFGGENSVAFQLGIVHQTTQPARKA